ncbi:unnamed protein product [Durusdinium trenchii]|uniref:Uncharacterized protein n=1 Tax=Durusdinium trenchii TaxID=1381693 RepID=A0ABP0SUX0_9DINO
MSYEALNLQDEEAQTEVPQAKTNSSVSWLVRGVSAGLVCATVAAIVLLKFASPVSSGNVLGAKAPPLSQLAQLERCTSALNLGRILHRSWVTTVCTS